MEIINDLKSQFITYYDSMIVLLPKLGIAIIIILLLHFMLKTIRTKLIKFLIEKADDKLLYNFANSILRIVNVVFIVIIFLYIVGLGKMASGILGAAGISAFVIGFALKDIGENFLAGIIMAFDRPFKVGDTVKTLDVEGKIVSMSLKNIFLKTSDGKDVYIPNAQIIKNPFYNYTIDGFMRHQFSIGVDYVTDVEEARKIVLETIKTIPGVLADSKPPRTHIKNLGDSSILLEAFFWINTFNTKHATLDIKTEAQTKVIQALAKANISMPGNILELKNNNDSIKFQNLDKIVA